MSGFLGGGNNSTATTRYTGLQLQTSAQGIPITLMWGTTRIKTNVFWYGDFVATPDGGKKGGKGGDGKGGAVYNYSTAIEMGLCEADGGLVQVLTVWADKQITSLSKLGFTLFDGSQTSPWSYLTSKHPDQALTYKGVAYLANSSYQLGKSPNLPNHTFEVQRLRFPWSWPATKDAILSQVMTDFLTNIQYSIAMPSAWIDSLNTFSNYQNYLLAQGLWFSPAIESQEQISSIVDRWAQLSNTWVFWSGNLLKAIPLGDQTISSSVNYTRSINTSVPLDPGPYQITFANIVSDGGVKYQQSGVSLTPVGSPPSAAGQYYYNALALAYEFNQADAGAAIVITATFHPIFSYTPNSTITFDLNYDNLVRNGTDSPILPTRQDQADLPNHVRIEFKNRNNAYNTDVAEWKDDDLINQYGVIDHPMTQAHEICDPLVAATVAQLLGQRAAYVRNTYEFTLNWWMGSMSEPGDLVTLTDPHIGLSLFTVMLRELEEDESGNWKVLAEEHTGTVGDPSGTIQQSTPVNTTVNPNISPGAINPPGVFEPASSLTNGVAQLWVAASGGPNWGGCVVYVSFDAVNYTNIGTISTPAAQGTLTAGLASHADPDTVDTLSIDTTISAVALNNDATHADADNYRTLCTVAPAFTTVCPPNGECMSYGAVAITGTYTDNITYLRRGLYGTSPSAHSSGDFFTRFDLSKTTEPGNSVLVYDLPAQYIGQAVYLKFCSFNRFANSLESLASVTAYTYTPTGAGYGGGAGGVPTTPTGLTATAGIGQNVLTWNVNPNTDNVDYYVIYAATGLSQPFASATQIGQSTSPNFIHTALGAGSQWTYFLKAHNAVGLSSPTGGVNCTTLTTVPNLFRLSGNLAGQPSAGQVLFEVEMVGGEQLPAGLSGSVGGCDVAPTGSVSLPLTAGGTALGSMNIASGATTASFSFASAHTFSNGDVLTFAAPASVDPTLSGLHYTFIGTR
jgi:hypothetical protein